MHPPQIHEFFLKVLFLCSHLSSQVFLFSQLVNFMTPFKFHVLFGPVCATIPYCFVFFVFFCILVYKPFGGYIISSPVVVVVVFCNSRNCIIITIIILVPFFFLSRVCSFFLWKFLDFTNPEFPAPAC